VLWLREYLLTSFGVSVVLKEILGLELEEVLLLLLCPRECLLNGLLDISIFFRINLGLDSGDTSQLPEVAAG